MPNELASHLRDVLVAGRNPDGGWGYYAGKSSRLEPTCWALLALLEDRRPDDAAVVDAGLRLLAKWQRADGLIAEPALPPNLAFNGLASLVFTAARSSVFTRARPRRGPAAAPRGHCRRPIREGLELGFTRPAGQLAGRLAVDRGCVRVDRSDGLVRARAQEGGLREARLAAGNDWSRPSDCSSTASAPGAAGTTVTAKFWGRSSTPTSPRRRSCCSRCRIAAPGRRCDNRSTTCSASGLTSPRGWRSVSRSTAFAFTRLPTAEVEAALATAWQKSAFLGNHAVVGMVRSALTAGMHGPNALAL